MGAQGWERNTGCTMRELKDKVRGPAFPARSTARDRGGLYRWQDVERLDREAQKQEVATTSTLADEVDFGEDIA